ncbi:hypothetical protein [Niastella koreensis]|nr:hypothetical protein [Niastella koreensis]
MISSKSFCQDNVFPSIDRYKYYGLDNKFYISFMPVSLIDFADGSSLRFSADAKVYKGIALSAEIGYYTYLSDYFAKPNAKGIIIKPALKYYLWKGNKCNGPYIGLEYQYKHQTYFEHDSISVNSAGYAKTYKMTRYVNCINAKFGYLNNLTRRIILEMYAGAGIRFFNSSTDLPQTEYDGILRGEKYGNDMNSGYQVRVLGRHTYPNISAGIKIGVRLR